MTCEQQRAIWLRRGLKLMVKKRMPGQWVVYDVNGSPCVVRPTWRDAWNKAYERAYQ